MISFRPVLISVFCLAFFSSAGIAQDLGKYREFQFGTSLDTVAKQVHMKLADAKTRHDRPAVLQTLDWDQIGISESATQIGSARSIRFDFYNDQLSRMVVTYNPLQTNGLTVDDLIQAISTVYGTPTAPGDSVAVPSFTTYEDQEKVLARWDDAKYSYNLYRSPYGNTYGLIAFSKALDLMARDATREADRLDKLEAPAKELAQQKKRADDTRASQETARSINKPKFQP